MLSLISKVGAVKGSDCSLWPAPNSLGIPLFVMKENLFTGSLDCCLLSQRIACFSTSFSRESEKHPVTYFCCLRVLYSCYSSPRFPSDFGANETLRPTIPFCLCQFPKPGALGFGLGSEVASIIMMLSGGLLGKVLCARHQKLNMCHTEQWESTAITDQSEKYMMTRQGHTEKNMGNGRN